VSGLRNAVVCGAHGFIGGWLVGKLKREGYWVRGVDVNGDIHSHSRVDPVYDEFMELDLRYIEHAALAVSDRTLGATKYPITDVYQLAANMGGMGFIAFNAPVIMNDNVVINANVLRCATVRNIERYFFSSSVCVYRDMELGEAALTEADAYPAMPDNEYGWEKLYSERMAIAHGKQHPIKVHVARFQNVYGHFCDYESNRAKAPAALCFKALKSNDGSINVWGDGTATRGFTHVEDVVDGVFTLMHSEEYRPVNIGSDRYVTIRDLAELIVRVSGKDLKPVFDEDAGPVGVQHRKFSKYRMKSLGWSAKTSLEDGIKDLYDWISLRE
jgi:GDP-D-mannose 3', 5'-epimerase